MNRHIKCLLLCLLCVPAWVDLGVAAERHPLKNPLFERISVAVSQITRISSRFDQERHTSMLEASLYSSGRFHYQAPDCLRWEVERPSVYGFETCGSRATRWRGESARAQVFSMDSEPGIKMFTEQIFAWIRADFALLEKRFRISVTEEKPVTLKLTPRDAAASGGLDHMFISFSSELTHVETIDIRETDGDYTLIRFSGTVINGPADKGLFQ